MFGGVGRRQDSLFLSYRACGAKYGERRALRGYRVLDMDMPLTWRTESRNMKWTDWWIVSLRNMLLVDCILCGVHAISKRELHVLTSECLSPETIRRLWWNLLLAMYTKSWTPLSFSCSSSRPQLCVKVGMGLNHIPENNCLSSIKMGMCGTVCLGVY